MSVEIGLEGRVLVATLNRAEKRNALDPATVDGIGAALDEAERNADVRAVVLTGAGDRAFCAGMDLTAAASGEQQGSRPGSERYQRFLECGGPKPVVAAVNGTAVAGGLELMLACDLAVAAEHARFGLPEVSRGLVPGAGGTLLPLRIPRVLASELALTGRLIDAHRAYEIGLLNAVVPGAQVLAAALDLASAVAANSPASVSATRRLLAQSSELTHGEAWRQIRAETATAIAGADAAEGARAFLQRREPNWVDLR